MNLHVSEAGRVGSIHSGVSGRNFNLITIFRHFLACLWQNPDNIAQCRKFCVRTILVWADTDLLGGFRGSWYSTKAGGGNLIKP